jgi:dCMP deaminase
MKDKYAIAHMKAAYVYATLSHCTRRKVGCVIVKNDSIIAIGYNGTPKGDCNTCEDKNGHTKQSVIHAEDNALRKLIKRNESSENSYVFVTTVPCKDCAVRLVDAGVSRVYFSETYRKLDRIEYLKTNGVEVIQLQIHNT